MTHKFKKEIDSVNDSITFYLDGEFIAHVNHDQDGWHGMETVVDVISRLAKKLEIEIEDVWV